MACGPGLRNGKGVMMRGPGGHALGTHARLTPWPAGASVHRYVFLSIPPRVQPRLGSLGDTGRRRAYCGIPSVRRACPLPTGDASLACGRGRLHPRSQRPSIMIGWAQWARGLSWNSYTCVVPLSVSSRIITRHCHLLTRPPPSKCHRIHHTISGPFVQQANPRPG